MKKNLLLLFYLSFLSPVVAQQKLVWGMGAGFNTPMGEQSRWLNNMGSMDMAIGVPLRFTKNRLWFMAEGRGHFHRTATYPITVPTETGPAFFEVEMYNFSTMVGGQFRFLAHTTTSVKPFIQSGAGVIFTRADLSIRDPRESPDVCYPLILDYREKSRSLYGSVGAGVLLISQKNLLGRSPEDGFGGLSFSVNYIHGFRPVTVYPVRTVRNGEPPVINEGKPVVGQFRNPVTGQDHTHVLTSAHQVNIRMLEFNLGFIVGGDIVNKKKQKKPDPSWW